MLIKTLFFFRRFKVTIKHFTAVSDNFSIHGTGNGNSLLKTSADFNESGSVDLFHNNTLKFSTAAHGITVSGNILPNANGTRDLGATGTRWANIYTNDLNLSNKGSTNSIDNTWGDYTIQEGESDLFLINNRSGKKYKFNLTEVS